MHIGYGQTLHHCIKRLEHPQIMVSERGPETTFQDIKGKLFWAQQKEQNGIWVIHQARQIPQDGSTRLRETEGIDTITRERLLMFSPSGPHTVTLHWCKIDQRCSNPTLVSPFCKQAHLRAFYIAPWLITWINSVSFPMVESHRVSSWCPKNSQFLKPRLNARKNEWVLLSFSTPRKERKGEINLLSMLDSLH